ncbi:MAG: nucleotidyltransferase domain-containing protein [Lacunisphaera sp.]|nr:nucleotidyltransferase domain-containing protein [Lacunisphaera sp.]
MASVGINPGMVKASTISNQQLHAVAVAIASRCAVERVVLFGSRAHNTATDDSDVDLAVVLPKGADVRASLRVIQRALWPRPFPVDVVPISSEAWHHRRGHLVRESPITASPSTSMPPDLAEASRWLAYAMEDLEHGKLGAASFPRSAAWSFQQAAEKALKALILASG